MSKMISDIVQKYYNEANQGLQKDKPPSALKRGEGTEKDFFILKIDLVGSTKFVRNRFPQTYLKLAHVFLSSVDEITRAFGAEDSQVEYAGDSVLAYFYANKVKAIDVLKAAHYTRLATLSIRALDAAFSKYKFNTRIILHYGKLMMAKIGPWGDQRLSAIGKELHKVGHLEKKIGNNIGCATKEFGMQLSLQERRKLLQGVYYTAEAPAPMLPAVSGLLGQPSLILGRRRLSELSTKPTFIDRSYNISGSHPTTQQETVKEFKYWKVSWKALELYVNGK